MIDLNAALIIFILITFVVYLLTRLVRIRWFSALTFALLVGYLVLITLRPWQSVDGYLDGNFNALVYLFVNTIVPIVIIIYIITKAFQDTN